MATFNQKVVRDHIRVLFGRIHPVYMITVHLMKAWQQNGCISFQLKISNLLEEKFLREAWERTCS